LSLLLRYFRPSGDKRLREYLRERLVERQLRLEQGDALGNEASSSSSAAALAGDEAAEDSIQAETLLEHGDASTQRITRQLLSLLVVLTSDAPALALFGPKLESRSDSGGRYYLDDDSAAEPQLYSLLSMLKEAHERLVDAQRQEASLRHSLAQLADAAAAPPSDEDDARFSFGIGGSGGRNSNTAASAIAALEQQFFPPSAAAAASYHELPPAARRAQLQQAAVRALHSIQRAREGAVWTLEHVSLLLHHHVRLYLPPPSPLSSSRRGASAPSASVSPAEFRETAEEALVPLLRDLLRALTPAPHGQVANGGGAKLLGPGDSSEQRLALYGGSDSALVLSSSSAATGGARLLSASYDKAAAGTFIPALIQRMLKIITG
jgi:hypothetical protein